jgi:CRP-like cAMP-binding protein
MAETSRPSGAYRNNILQQLSPEQLARISSRWQKVELQLGQRLYAPNEPIEYAYFIEAGLLSVVAEMQNGDKIEVGRIGSEGLAGATVATGADATLFGCLVQIAGTAYRIDAATLKAECENSNELRSEILLYQSAFLTLVAQVAACNRLHSVSQRCCRGLLMFHDSTGRNGVSLNSDFLSIMLGVRLASLREILQPLHENGWIKAGPTEITINDRKGLESRACECYGAIARKYDQMLVRDNSSASSREAILNS